MIVQRERSSSAKTPQQPNCIRDDLTGVPGAVTPVIAAAGTSPQHYCPPDW
jgi:hypothetical protein